MKNQTFFFTFLFLLLIIKLGAVTKTSIANGNWSDSTIWSPAGVPVITDNVIIATDVILDQPVTLLGFNNFFNINAGASLLSINPADTTIMLGLGVENSLIDGEIYVSRFDFGYRNTPSDSLINNGIIKVTTDIISSATIVNNPTGQICVGRAISHYDFLTNNGSINATIFANASILTGSGRICISTAFMNLAFIGGTLDICDATPNDPSDFNMGTIATTVTYCQSQPCAICVAPNSISENNIDNKSIEIYPSPMTDRAIVTIENAEDGAVFEIMSLQGQVIKSVIITSSVFELERDQLCSGIYLYRLTVNGVSSKAGKLVVQ
ncbi:MAG: T9SS type A sorting domain-containing protein [Bacteroidia bacterium]